MDYLCGKGREITLKALEVADELQDWLDLSEGGTIPVAYVEVSGIHLFVKAGDTTVWEAGQDTEAELTADYCKEVYRSDVYDLLLAINFEEPKWMKDAMADVAKEEGQ